MPETLSKTIGDKAHKAYIRRLNKLAGAGYDTPEKILKTPSKVVALIKTLAPGDDEKAQQEKRYFISAIFYVLPAKYREKPNPFYTLTKKSRPPGWNEDREEYLNSKD
jgi:hypothetical protein